MASAFPSCISKKVALIPYYDATIINEQLAVYLDYFDDINNNVHHNEIFLPIERNVVKKIVTVHRNEISPKFMIFDNFSKLSGSSTSKVFATGRTNNMIAYFQHEQTLYPMMINIPSREAPLITLQIGNKPAVVLRFAESVSEIVEDSQPFKEFLDDERSDVNLEFVPENLENAVTLKSYSEQSLTFKCSIGTEELCTKCEAYSFNMPIWLSVGEKKFKIILSPKNIQREWTNNKKIFRMHLNGILQAFALTKMENYMETYYFEDCYVLSNSDDTFFIQNLRGEYSSMTSKQRGLVFEVCHDSQIITDGMVYEIRSKLVRSGSKLIRRVYLQFLYEPIYISYNTALLNLDVTRITSSIRDAGID